jgi:hypothetical protein
LSLFRRSEPLHVRLAREGGLLLGPEEEPRGPWDAAGIHGLHRVRERDVVATVDAPEIPGDRAEFVAISPEELVIQSGPSDVAVLANTVERDLAPPYRAEAVRRDGTLWAVAARKIEVVRLPGVRGDEVELATHGDERTLVIDGEQTFGSIPELERPNQVARARRIDGELWELEVDPL